MVHNLDLYTSFIKDFDDVMIKHIEDSHHDIFGEMFRRLYRIFSHTFFHHFDVFDEHEVIKWLRNKLNYAQDLLC